MAANKANRSIPAAQPARRRPDSEPNQLMPIKVHVYRTIAELNAGFEKVLQDLQTLGHVNFLGSASVTTMHSAISRIRAQVNQEFTLTLHQREAANAAYFGRLSAESRTETKEPFRGA